MVRRPCEGGIEEVVGGKQLCCGLEIVSTLREEMMVKR